MLKKYIIVGIILVGIGALFFFLQKEKRATPKLSKNIVTEIIKATDTITISTTDNCSDADVELFLKQFIVQFQTNEAAGINTFINKKDCLAVFLRDGYYPILSFPNKINDWIEWFDFKIYDNILFEKFPIYLGNNEFEKKGFFCVKYQNKFNLNDFDDTYTALSDADKLPYKQLEKKCNYRADAMSLDGSEVVTFYFSIHKNEKSLVGITKDQVDDGLFSDSKKDFISIDSKEEVEYFVANKKFCDSANNGYVDFDKKELTYVDFGDKPFPFAKYKIGPLSILSKKIKVREVKFFNVEENDGLTLRLSNKGTFTSYQMGARPLYVYSSCED